LLPSLSLGTRPVAADARSADVVSDADAAAVVADNTIDGV
jgi:hypothetical protein